MEGVCGADGGPSGHPVLPYGQAPEFLPGGDHSGRAGFCDAQRLGGSVQISDGLRKAGAFLRPGGSGPVHPHGRIARDFASYLELYYKYQAHYQIDEALSGRRSEALLEQAARAPFDEKLSVISLVLAKLNVEFRKTGKMEDGLELLFEKLKAFKEQLAEAGDGTPVQRLTAFTREVREEYEGKKQAGLLTRAQIHRYEDICGTLDQYLLAAGEAEAQDGETLFGMLAARFGEGREQYEDQCRAVLRWWSTPSILWRAPLGTARKWSFSSQS